MGISVHSLVRRPGVKVGAGSERSRVCPPPASPQPPALAFPGSRAQSRASRPPGERARGLGGLSGLPSRATHSPRKKGRIGSRCGVGGGLGCSDWSPAPHRPFFQPVVVWGPRLLNPEPPRARKEAFSRHPGLPRPLPGVRRGRRVSSPQPAPGRLLRNVAEAESRGEREDRGI